MSGFEGPGGGPPSMAVDLGIPGVVDAVEIGRGGFAVVYRARRPGFDQSVAVKVLAAALDSAARKRFDLEVRAMGALFGHPHIVGIITAGFTAGDRPYIVMEDMTGGSLADALRTRGHYGWQEALETGDGLASALEAAHSAHVLHRDIKPENVLYSRYGSAKLGDFGLASFTEGPETRSTSVMVSIAHTAPEVLDGAPRAPGTDVYALASTIMTMIIGRPPFARGPEETAAAIFKRISTEPPPDMRTLGVPDPVCRVLERALAKSPEQRYATATAFRNDLEQSQGRETTGARGDSATLVDRDVTEQWTPTTDRQPPPPPVGPVAETAHGVDQPPGSPPPRGGRRPLRSRQTVALAVGGAVAAIVLVVVLLTRGPGPATNTQPHTRLARR